MSTFLPTRSLDAPPRVPVGPDPAVAPTPPPTLPADAGRRSPRPEARGELSHWLLSTFDGLRSPAPAAVSAFDDPLTGDDFHLALQLVYELSYRGVAGVPDLLEVDPAVVAFRGALEAAFEGALRDGWQAPVRREAGAAVDDLLAAADGRSLSRWMLEHADIGHMREFAVHRSAYQLKEADPHTWGLPRLSGARKAAFVEIQMDEYGEGRPGEAHAELFAAAMRSLDLDARYGAYLDRLPGLTLATGNLVSLLGLQRRLTPALLGHLAVFEMTSVEPMSRYAALCDRLRLDHRVRRFYDVHVEADQHHGRLARQVLIGGDTDADGLPAAEVHFGATALMAVENRMTEHLLGSWTTPASSLRP